MFGSWLQFDVSKIPDIYDVLKYHLIHNTHIGVPGVAEIYPISKALADIVVPQEYGITDLQKKELGSKICHNLLRKILFDLTACKVRRLCHTCRQPCAVAVGCPSCSSCSCSSRSSC